MRIWIICIRIIFIWICLMILLLDTIILLVAVIIAILFSYHQVIYFGLDLIIWFLELIYIAYFRLLLIIYSLLLCKSNIISLPHIIRCVSLWYSVFVASWWEFPIIAITVWAVWILWACHLIYHFIVRCVLLITTEISFTDHSLVRWTKEHSIFMLNCWNSLWLLYRIIILLTVQRLKVFLGSLVLWLWFSCSLLFTEVFCISTIVFFTIYSLYSLYLARN